MISTLIDRWWAVALVGVLAIILGVVAFTMPGVTIVSLVAAFGAYALVSGIVELVAGFSKEANSMLGPNARTYLLVTGALGVVAALITFFYPGMTLLALYSIIGAWAVLSGISTIASAITHREQRNHTWLVAAGGAVSVLFGVYMFMRPGVGLLALTYALGTFAVVYGVAMLVGSFQLKQVKDRGEVTIGRVTEPVATPTDTLTPR
jgi:uncharacterized membrane protein HdeD (DUF308 family)